MIEGKLYLAGIYVAHDREALLNCGITHVINLCGKHCANKFSSHFTYFTYYVNDSKDENIEGLFYEIIERVDWVIQEGGRVLVHCVEGISRSVSLCAAYLMFKNRINYHSAY